MARNMLSMLVLLNPFGTTNWEQNWISWYPLCGTKYIPRIRWVSILTFGALPGIRIALLNTYYNVKFFLNKCWLKLWIRLLGWVHYSIKIQLSIKLLRILISILIQLKKELYGLIFLHYHNIISSYGKEIISSEKFIH